MRLITTLLITTLLFGGLLLATACTSPSSSCDTPTPPTCGTVLAACCDSGTITISLGAGDGVRTGDSVTVSRGGALVTEVILHDVKADHALGSAYGETKGVQPGDKVTYITLDE